MISRWTLANFKSIKEPTDLQLRPLTLIAGTNSSGKSTVLQSILLITQTLQSRFRKKQLVLNSELTKLGTPENVLHFENQEQHLEIGGTLYLKRSTSTFRLIFQNVFKGNSSGFQLDQFGYHSDNQNLHTKKLSNIDSEHEVISSNIISSDNTIIFSQFLPSNSKIQKSSLSVFREELNALDGLIKSILLRQDEIEGEYNEGLSNDAQSLILKVIDQLRLSKEVPEDVLGALSNVTNHEDFRKFVFDLHAYDVTIFEGFRNSFENRLLRSGVENTLGNKTRTVKNKLPKSLSIGISSIRDYFENRVHYLGPLRDDPRVIYSIPNNVDFRHVGLKGEFTAAMLNLYGLDTITYPSPSDIQKVVHGTLLEGVSTWLAHMGLADSLDVQELTSIGYQLNIHQSNLTNNLALTNIGVGVSQVLPTLVMCLLVEDPCTLLVEQPELHLHPKVQSILGDFFLGLTYCNKQIIVETHSEHIINRLFLRIAEDNSDEFEATNTRNRISILFAEKIASMSYFRLVEPNTYGVINEDEWPQGFLDQATKELQSKIKAGKGKRENKKGLLR